MKREKIYINSELIEENLAYYEGDTWPYWVGPYLPADDPKSAEVMNEVKRVFQSANKIRECVNRHRRALIGNPPKWFFSINGERNDNLSDAERQLQQLLLRWKQLNLGTQNAVQTAVTNFLIYGTGYLRLWSPTRFANSENPLFRVAIHSPPIGAVEVVRDEAGFIEEIKYTYEEDDQLRMEIQRIDEAGLTVFRIEDGSGNILSDEFGDMEFSLDLGGRYTIYELKRHETLLSRSAKQAQNAINFQLTLMLRNSTFAGFLREIITNAQPPGEWRTDGSGKEVFIPAAESIATGPATTTFLTGIPLYDDQGGVRGYAQPGVSQRQPVSVDTFLTAARAFVAIIYEEMGQSHLLSSDAVISGVSRVQLRQDFETALREDGDTVAAGLSSIYAAAFLMLNQENVLAYSGLDVVTQLSYSVSKPLPEELSENRENYRAGLRSRVTAMADSGIDDVDAEVALIEEELRENTRPNDSILTELNGILNNDES